MLTLVVVSISYISKIIICDMFSCLATTHDLEKIIPEVEWDTQEEIQPLELPHRLTHICCQISSLSPGLSYDQQCYQWFTGKLNRFIDTYLFMFDPDCIFCHSDRCKKVKKAHYWTKEPLSKFEFGGEENVIRTAEVKNKIMIFFYGSKYRTFVLVKTSSTQVVWKGTQQTHNHGTVWM